jgi:hypothetical protein
MGENPEGVCVAGCLEWLMPEKETIERARRDKREGKAASTQAGEFIREQIHHIREGKHGAQSAKQVIAIGLSQARRAGVDLPPPKKGKTSEKTRRNAERANERGQESPARGESSGKRARASEAALKKEGRSAASHEALSRHAVAAAGARSAGERSASAKKAARTRAENS